jgi:hypothetical protein
MTLGHADMVLRHLRGRLAWLKVSAGSERMSWRQYLVRDRKHKVNKRSQIKIKARLDVIPVGPCSFYMGDVITSDPAVLPLPLLRALPGVPRECVPQGC